MLRLCTPLRSAALALCGLLALACPHAQTSAQIPTPTPTPTPTPAASPSPTPAPTASPVVVPAPSASPANVAAPAASPSPSPRPALLKLRAQFKTNGGEQDVSLKRFFLLREDFERVATSPPSAPTDAPARSAYYASIGASPELIAWLAANNCDYVYCREITQTDLRVPEFQTAFERGVRKWRNREIALRWLTVNLPDKFRIGYYKRRTPAIENLAARSGVVAEVVTSEKGVALIPNVPPGDYFISSLLPIEVGGACVLWHHKITVKAGKTGKEELVTLDNSNARLQDCGIARSAQPIAAQPIAEPNSKRP